jgi:hypothetical protein
MTSIVPENKEMRNKLGEVIRIYEEVTAAEKISPNQRHSRFKHGA